MTELSGRFADNRLPCRFFSSAVTIEVDLGIPDAKATPCLLGINRKQTQLRQRRTLYQFHLTFYDQSMNRIRRSMKSHLFGKVVQAEDRVFVLRGSIASSPRILVRLQRVFLLLLLLRQ
jgi:hypothetical protein